MRSSWNASGELRGVFENNKKVPDILITEKHKLPIVIETEIYPARTLDRDATEKIGLKTKTGDSINAVITIRIPESLKEHGSVDEIKKNLRENKFEYRVLTTQNNTNQWFPVRGYLSGSLRDISYMAQTVNTIITDLDKQIEEIMTIIQQASTNIPNSRYMQISKILSQEKGTQTNNMAMAILLNAFIFQEILSGIDFDESTSMEICDGDNNAIDIPTIAETRDGNHISITKTSKAWFNILKFNYYPIFMIAREIIHQIPESKSHRILDCLANGAAKMTQIITDTNDVTSSVFQKLISDQKILAVFYTRPETATMMAMITCPPNVVDITEITLADFACGTGILLHAFYRRLGQVYESDSDSSDEKHAQNHHNIMMENRIIGCDVLPSHVHLTASSLAGLYMNKKFSGTRLYIMDYGEQKEFKKHKKEYEKVCKTHDELKEKKKEMLERKNIEKNKNNKMSEKPKLGMRDMNKNIKNLREQIRKINNEKKIHSPVEHVRCGSLELLDDKQTTIGAFDLSQMSTRVTSGTDKDIKIPTLNIPTNSCDIVTMNPPFSDSTNPEQKSKKVHNPAFAGFNTSTTVQKAMAARRKKLGDKLPPANGMAPPHFIMIADRMLKKDGCMAVVLPLAFAQGESWEPTRQFLIKNYDDFLLISAAGYGDKESSFSAETGIREVILVATKIPENSKQKKRKIKYVILKKASHSNLISHELGKVIGQIRHNQYPISDFLTGAGATPILIGEEEVGNAVSDTVDLSNNRFKINTILDMSLAISAEKLRNGTLCLSLTGESATMPMTTMEKIGEGGLLSRDIVGKADKKDESYEQDESDKSDKPRGPFTFTKETNNRDYPAVHKHDNKTQRQMIIENDGYYVPKPDAEQNHVKNTWKKSSKVIIATHFQFNSQPCPVVMTKTRVLGGSTFPNFILDKKKHEKAFVVWSNSTFGILCFWFHSSRQQVGRGIITKNLRYSMPVLDFNKLKPNQLNEISKIFDGLKNGQMLSINELPRDTIRHEIDKKIIKVLVKDKKKIQSLCEELSVFYNKLSSEPTICGIKK